MGQPRPLFCLFSSFSNTNFTEKTVEVSRIRTRIVRVEGEHADRLTTTTAQFLVRFSQSIWNSVNLKFGQSCTHEILSKIRRVMAPTLEDQGLNPVTNEKEAGNGALKTIQNLVSKESLCTQSDLVFSFSALIAKYFAQILAWTNSMNPLMGLSNI